MKKTANKAKAAVGKVKSAIHQPKDAATPSLTIPPPDTTSEDASAPKTPKTPKTPADEGIDFFESAVKADVPVNVYELRLDPDGGPSKELAVSVITLSFPHGLHCGICYAA